MANQPRVILALAAALALVSEASLAAPAAPAAGTIEIWQRAPGVGAGGGARVDVRVVELDKLPLLEVRRPDIQYGGIFGFRGVRLVTLLERYDAPASVDLVLLHFANGMQVPLAFRDSALVERLDPLVARQIRLSPGEPFVTGQFPPIDRARAGFVDVRPIQFGANKLVVGRSEHPAVPPTNQDLFSPWKHVDSLTGIELVSAKAYYAQLDVDPDPKVRAGFQLFQQSCQFCHGARKVGAAFGWDFVEPTPIYSYRGGKNLFYHVKYKPLDAAAKGLLMPALSYMTEDDAAALSRWLRAVATKPMPSYAPERLK
jgi:mono/diheme cytochrome c family protein